MKKRGLRLGISLLFTFAAIIEIALAVVLVLVMASVFSISVNDVSTTSFIGLLVIVIGGATAWVVNRVLLSPIKRLSDAMDMVANGDFNVSLEPGKRIKEIKNIYEKFNLMTKELRSTEILQSDFVSNVSHEIKTPITSIEGYTMLLQDEKISAEDKKRFIDKIQFNTKRLSELVENVLLLSKIDNQAIETKRSRYRLDEQIRQSILLLEPKWAEKQIEFDVELENVYFEGNENLLRNVWNNLIANAIKFSPQGGKVVLRLKQDAETNVFWITDEGSGIKEEEQQKIFQKFYQADDSRKQEGNGLGLALVKKILDLYQGEIQVENLPEKGCKFTVILINEQ